VITHNKQYLPMVRTVRETPSGAAELCPPHIHNTCGIPRTIEPAQQLSINWTVRRHQPCCTTSNAQGRESASM
jgi:hypothetical protein